MADRTPEPVRRPRGRPRVSEPRATVATWLPASQHDKLIKIAHRHGASVSGVLRRLVSSALRDDRTFRR